MPRRITSKKYGKKRGYRRYKRSSDTIVSTTAMGSKVAGSVLRKAKNPFNFRPDLVTTFTNPKQLGFLPKSLFTQHRYCQELTLTSDGTTGYSGNENAFRLNSLYDPDLTGTGHQPLGYDQMGGLYKRYLVYKADISVKVLSITNNNCWLGMRLTAANASYTVGGLKLQSEVAEQPGCQVMDAMVGNVINMRNIYMADIQGCPRSRVFDDAYFSANVGSNPSESPIFSIATGSNDGITGAGVKVLISFVFYTLWNNSQPQAQS